MSPPAVENRIRIWTPEKEGRPRTRLAVQIGCSVSTILREPNRNRSKKGYQSKKT